MSQTNNPRAAIQSITIHDFRGFPGNHVSPIELKGKSLLLYGENGSGKSTIFHALKDLFGGAARFNKNVFHRTDSPVGKITLSFGNAVPAMEWTNADTPTLPGAHPHYDTIARSAGFLDYRAILRTHFVDAKQDAINVWELVIETLLRNIEYPNDRNKKFYAQWESLNEVINVFHALPAESPAKEDLPTQDRIGFDPRDWADEEGDGYDSYNYLEKIEDGSDDADENAGVYSQFDDDYDIDERYQRFLDAERTELETEINAFDTALLQRLTEIEQSANAYLQRFDPLLEIRFGVSDLQNRADPLAQFAQTRLLLQARYRSHPVEHPGIFLNEARLTAIALVIYFAALKLETPQSANAQTPRLLVLDDVLIGLDMANRYPMLEIVREEFADQGWQVLLMTYDRVWFDIVKSSVSDSWAVCELFSCRVENDDIPLLKNSHTDHLACAEAFLKQGEVKAAAAHIRTEYEKVLKKACDEWSISVRYNQDPRKVDSSHFWEALQKSRNKDGSPYVSADLQRKVQYSTSWVLNPAVHSNEVDHYQRDLQNAIEAVRELKRDLKKPKPA